MRPALLFCAATLFSSPAWAVGLTAEVASGFSELALRCVRKEFPNKLDHVMSDAGEVLGPRALHPAFYGCYDWHSSVHGHWMLARLLRRFPSIATAPKIREALSANLTAANLAGELAYLGQKNRKSFERTYGWAWLLKLAEELHGWDDPDAKRWSGAVKPLADEISSRYVAFLPKQDYPIRQGVHPNTAFGLAFALDYARAVGDTALERVLADRALFYFAKDRAYAVEWEPSGEDFFSPALMEADLMRRVLAPAKFKSWAEAFFSGFQVAKLKAVLTPARVSDRSDPRLVHLDGLNLSRAWCMRGIAGALPPAHSGRKLFLASADEHARAALSHLETGSYEGEHWLASFAVYLETL